MTLIVSLRIPDGIVLAGDSLANSVSRLQARVDIPITCPECGHQHAISQNIPLPSMSGNAYAQKVFPLLGEYGIGTFGVGQLAGKSIYYLLRELEHHFLLDNLQFDSVTDVAQEVADYLHGILLEDARKANQDVEKFNENWIPVGFQMVGYNNHNAITVEAQLGKTIKLVEHEQPGLTVSGHHVVVRAIIGLYNNPVEKPAYESFSLQDAISYAEFLINTTAAHQQFSRMVPTVGGDIDIALVTPFDKFKWIRQKELGKLLGS